MKNVLNWESFNEKYKVKPEELEKEYSTTTKSRSRGRCIFPAEHADVDKSDPVNYKDHYPINNVAQARNALARVSQHDSLPDWYKGKLTLGEFKDHIRRAVAKAYPSIDVTYEKDLKKD